MERVEECIWVSVLSLEICQNGQQTWDELVLLFLSNIAHPLISISRSFDFRTFSFPNPTAQPISSRLFFYISLPNSLGFWFSLWALSPSSSRSPSHGVINFNVFVFLLPHSLGRSSALSSTNLVVWKAPGRRSRWSARADLAVIRV